MGSLNLLCTKRDVLRDKINHSLEQLNNAEAAKPHCYLLPFVISPSRVHAVIKHHTAEIKKYSPKLEAIEGEILNFSEE